MAPPWLHWPCSRPCSASQKPKTEVSFFLVLHGACHNLFCDHRQMIVKKVKSKLEVGLDRSWSALPDISSLPSRPSGVRVGDVKSEFRLAWPTQDPVSKRKDKKLGSAAGKKILAHVHAHMSIPTQARACACTDTHTCRSHTSTYGCTLTRVRAHTHASTDTYMHSHAHTCMNYSCTHTQK